MYFYLVRFLVQGITKKIGDLEEKASLACVNEREREEEGGGGRGRVKKKLSKEGERERVK